MKKLRNIFFVILSSIVLFSCSYDDSEIWSEIDVIKTELVKLNGQVTSIQTLVDALNNGKVITQVDEMSDGKGYTITFNDGKKIEIIHGTEAPVVGIKEENGVYYWTITTNDKSDFLLDANDNKIPVKGEDGETPQLAVNEEGYWTINNQRIIDANGNHLKATGESGDSFFKNITETNESVIFELADGSTIKLPKAVETSLVFEAPGDNNSYYLFNFEEERELKLKVGNMASAELLSKPKDWNVEFNLSTKTVTVTAPKQSNQSFSGGLIKIQGIDKNGLVYLATADVRASVDFTDPDGTFVVCEGNMTSVNGILVYYDKNGKEYQKVFQNANSALEIGNVVQDMYIANNRVYLLTQNGSNMDGAGRFVVCDARTMKMIYADPLIIKTPEGKGTWPQHLVVTSENSAYIQYSDNEMETTSGICELELKDKSVTVKYTVDGTFGKFTSVGAIKTRLVFSKGKIYAGVGETLAIINPLTSSIEKSLPFPGRQVKGVVKASDGNIYVALASTYDGDQNSWGEIAFTGKPKIVGINHSGEIIHEQDFPNGIQFAISTFSPSVGMCASFTDPHLYFIDSPDFGATTASRYNYMTKEFDVNYLNAPETIYGVMGIHPTTKDWWVGTSSYVNSDIFVFDVTSGAPQQKYKFRYKTQMGASPASVDFTYRFTPDWVNK